MKFGYLDKFDRHETPVGEYHPVVQGRRHQLYAPHRVPYNEYQALMETPPYGETEMTEQEREADWESFRQKLLAAGLTDREQITVDCIVFGGMSLTKTAAVIGAVEQGKPPSKMQVSRYRDRGFDKLRNTFKENN